MSGKLTFKIISGIFIIIGLCLFFTPFVTISFLGESVSITGMNMTWGINIEAYGEVINLKMNYFLVFAFIIACINCFTIFSTLDEISIFQVLLSLAIVVLLIVFLETYKNYYGWNTIIIRELVEISWGYIATLICMMVATICGILDGIGLSEKIFNNYNNTNHSSALSNYSDEMIIAQQLKDGYWKCLCGKLNPPYTTGCSCGLTVSEINKRKHQQEKIVAEQKENKQKEAEERNIASEKNNIVLLKEYKDLLDNGIITQEEFDKKKHELLNI